jgi:hypothetical protein
MKRLFRKRAARPTERGLTKRQLQANRQHREQIKLITRPMRKSLDEETREQGVLTCIGILRGWTEDEYLAARKRAREARHNRGTQPTNHKE